VIFRPKGSKENSMLRIIENTGLGLVFGAVPAISGFLAGWWISLPLVSESHIMQWALAGLLLGVLVDAIFLAGWIRGAYSAKPWVWMAVYVFYSIGLFGMFMGVPVFHVLLALPAGVFIGRWLVRTGADSIRVRKAARQSAIWTTGVLGLVCIASAAVALASPSTASDLHGMLGLPFAVTPAMILGLILGGGIVILALEWWLTLQTVKRAYGFFIARSKSPLS
jgi:hypothetical protein